MASIKLAFMSVGQKTLTLALVILELTALFVTEIYTISILRERSMLIAPYSGILSQNSFFVYDKDFPLKLIEDNSLTFSKSQEELLKDIKGDYQIYNFLSATINSYYIVSVSDDIYESLELPLSSGDYGREKNSAVASKGIGKGKLTINTDDGGSFEINISGNLTDNTYIPGVTGYSSDITANDLYYPTNDKNLIITGRSSIQGYEDYFDCDIGFWIIFKSDIQENVDILKSKAAVTEGTRLADNTQKALNDDLKSFIPLVCCIMLIVIIGIVCISLTIFNENQYRNGVLWLCGYSKAKILALHAESITILPVIALAAAAIILLIAKVMGIELAANIRLSLPCCAAVLITCFFLLAASMIAPMIKTAGKSPVEYLGRSK